MQLKRWLVALVFTSGAWSSACGASEAPLVLVGAAKVDITPTLPIWLSGYAARPAETTRVEKRLFARALAIGSAAEPPVVLVTVEIVGITAELSDAVAAGVAASDRVPRERIAVAVTHTHNGPAIAGVLPFMYGRDLAPEEEARIATYTEELKGKLITVAQAALRDRKPGRLAWGQGAVDFAVQRRRIVNGKWTGFGVDPKGEVDRALPVLRASDAGGGVRAVLVNYACHCTTLQGGDNFVHSDWAGDAAERIETATSGAVALVAIGCGADANPKTRTLAAVSDHGSKVAAEVARLLGTDLRPLGAVTSAKAKRIELPLDATVTREELEKRRTAGAKPQSAYAASKLLAALDAGRPPPTVIPYPIQTWSFGSELTMVFLGGEVVAGYALRLKSELDGERLWITAYANAVPAYIPTRAMYAEGGYEVDSSMEYYGWATRLGIGTEDAIIGTVRDLVPRAFHRSGGQTK